MNPINPIKHLAIITVSLAVLSGCAIAADVLDLGSSARSLGIGRSYTSIDNDAAGIFGNPAGLYSLNKPQLTSMYSELTSDVKYTMLGGAWPASFGTVGVGYYGNFAGDFIRTTMEANGRVGSLDSFSYNNNLFILAFGRQLNRKVAWGARIKVIQKGSPDISGGAGNGLNADLAMMYDFSDEMNAGVVLTNVIPGTAGGIKWSNGYVDEMPSGFDMGFGYRKGSQKYYGDFSIRKAVPLEMRLGAEWNIWKTLVLRGGLERKSLGLSDVYINYSAGVGYDFGGLGVDYAYYYDGLLPYNSRHFVSLSYSLQGKALPPIIIDKGTRVVTSSETVMVAGRISDNRIKYIKVGNRDASIKNDNFKTEIMVDVGRNRVDVLGIDKEGNVLASAEVRIVRLKMFKDIDDNWAKEPVMYLSTLGIVKGIINKNGVERFRPEKGATRAEIVTLLARAMNAPKEGFYMQVFKDVPVRHWAAPYIKYGIGKKWVTGYTNGTFKPNVLINRIEGVMMISRFAGLERKNKVPYDLFPDIKANNWAARDVFPAKAAGLLDYIGTAPFEPGKKLSRAETCEMLYRTEFVKKQIRNLLNFDAW